jgi:hypothetical protein
MSLSARWSARLWWLVVATFLGSLGYLIFGTSDRRDPVSVEWEGSASQDTGPSHPFSDSGTPPQPPATPAPTVRPPPVKRDSTRNIPRPDTTSQGTPDSSLQVEQPPAGTGTGPIPVLSSHEGAGPNEPAGFSPVAFRTFGQREEGGWETRGDRNLSVLEDATSPGSPPQVGRATFPGGFEGGRGPVRTGFEMVGAEFTSLYISFWVRLSDNWEGHPSGVNKILHIWIAGGNKVYLSAQGQGRQPLRPQVRLQGINERPISRNLQPNFGGTIRRGSWQRWEVLLRANAHGSPAAVAEWWIDGRRAGSHSGINLVRPNKRPYWERVDWNPTWGGRGSSVSITQFMDLDDLYISGSK